MGRMRTRTLKIRGENFHEWFQIREIRESFIPRKFPAIRYIYILCRMILLKLVKEVSKQLFHFWWLSLEQLSM